MAIDSYRFLDFASRQIMKAIYHLHIDPQFGAADLDVLLPMRRLEELASEGVIGAAASRHYSTMGYLLDAKEFVQTTAPAIARQMHADGVNGAVLLPA